MIPLLTADEMRALEARAIREWGIPSLVLQEHAALGALALDVGLRKRKCLVRSIDRGDFDFESLRFERVREMRAPLAHIGAKIEDLERTRGRGTKASK